MFGFLARVGAQCFRCPLVGFVVAQQLHAQGPLVMDKYKIKEGVNMGQWSIPGTTASKESKLRSCLNPMD